MKRSVLIKLSSALIASASMLSLSGIGNTPVNASLTGSLVMGSAKIVGKLVLLPVKLASGVIIQIALPTTLFAGLSAYGLNKLLSTMTDEQFQLCSLDSIKAKIGYASKGNNLVGKVTIGQLRSLIDYADGKFGKEQPPVLDKNLLGLVKNLSDKGTWAIDGLEKIDLEYLLDRNNDDTYVIVKKDILDTLINSRKNFRKAVENILSNQKENVTNLFVNLFTKKVF